MSKFLRTSTIGRERFRRQAFGFLLAIAIPPGLAAAQSGGEKADPHEPALYKYRTDWSKMNGGRGNFFLFIFRDIDRNGIYDVGDRPITGVYVEMTSPSNKTFRNRSNLNGFASFTGSMTQDEAIIRQPGSYKFEALIPKGWINTTNNKMQIQTFTKFPGTTADMIADRMPDPVGLAPELTISGHVLYRTKGKLEPSPEAALWAIDSEGNRIDIALDNQGGFALPAVPGEWKLSAKLSQNGQEFTAERVFSVESAPVYISNIVLGDEQPPPRKQIELIDFDSITKSTLAEIPSGVGGLNWHNAVATNFLYYNGPGYVNNSISGEFVAYSSGGHPVTISRDEPFDFAGAYFGAAWPKAHGETLIAKAWDKDGNPIGEDRLTLSVLGPTWFDADYRGVSKLELSTEHYWHFVTDDFRIRID